MSAGQAEEGATLPFLDAVKDLLVDALGSRLSPGVAGYMDLFAEDGVLETPYVAPGSTSRLQGKPAIAGFLATLRGVIRLAEFRLLAAYPAQDDVAVLEYEGTVYLEKQGTRFQQRYISVLRLRGGRLALWREYTNPLAAQGASAAP